MLPVCGRCIAELSISALRVGDEVDVGMSPDEECQHEMFVLIRGERRALAVPLAKRKLSHQAIFAKIVAWSTS